MESGVAQPCRPSECRAFGDGVGACVLAGELATSQDRPEEAFRRYQDRLRPFIYAKQRAAERVATSFVPRTRLGVFFRNQVIKAFRIPAIARIAIGRDIRDQLELPRFHP